MKLEGIVTNVTAFGAFVDIGVHQDGLVHVSEIADRFVKDPSEVVKAGDRLKVTVLDVDVARKRISLSARQNARPEMRAPQRGARDHDASRGYSPNRSRNSASTFSNNPFAGL